MNVVYLKVGNYDEILNMSYWRFKGILDTLEKINAISSGKPYLIKKLPRSSKDMIEKRKAQR